MYFTYKNRKINILWILGAVAIILFIALQIRQSAQYFNFQEYLKTEIESLKKQNNQLDSIYKVVSTERQRIKIIREKISIVEELNRMERLKRELEILRGEMPLISDSMSVSDLERYFVKEFKK
jgi:predicted RND superfamily exporter protein